MKKATIAGVLSASMLIPVAFVGANEARNYTVDEAAQTIKEHDYNSKITDYNDTEISRESQAYMEDIEDQLDTIKHKNNTYNDLQKTLSAEMSAYETLYNYWAVKESLKVQKENISLAEKEHKLMLTRIIHGVASEADLQQVETKINNLKINYEDTLLQEKSLRMQLNKGLDHNIMDANFQVNVPEEFTQLDMTENSPESVFEAVKKNHAQINLLEEIIEEYESIVKDVEVLPSQDSGGGNIPVQQPTDMTAPNAEVFFKNDSILAGVLSSFGSSSSGSKDDAEDELDDYYSEELDEARIRLNQGLESIEILTYRYIEQFKTLSKKIDLYTKNIEITKSLYDKTVQRLEQGLVTATQVEEARLSQEQAQLQLLQTQKEYLVLKEEFRLFKDEGYMPRG